MTNKTNLFQRIKDWFYFQYLLFTIKYFPTGIQGGGL